MFGQIEITFNFPNRYAIRRKDPSPIEWYFRDVLEEHSNGVVWVKFLPKAKIFYSEEAVEEFKFAFLKRRPCEIILLPER